MIFNSDQLSLQLLEVVRLDEETATVRTKPRPFYALSLRQTGETDIVSKKGTVHLKGRDLALFRPNFGYTRYSKNDKKIVFHFSLQNRSAHQNVLESESDYIEVLHDFRFDSLWPIFCEAYEVWSSQESGYHIRCTALLYSIFADVRKHLVNTPKDISTLTGAVCEYISAHYHENSLNVEMLAERFYVSSTRLRDCFNKDLGIAPKAYIIKIRMEKAQALLNAGSYSIADVAERTGFRDSKNFSTAYKKYFGYSPSAQKYKDFRAID